MKEEQFDKIFGFKHIKVRPQDDAMLIEILDDLYAEGKLMTAEYLSALKDLKQKQEG